MNTYVNEYMRQEDINMLTLELPDLRVEKSTSNFFISLSIQLAYSHS